MFTLDTWQLIIFNTLNHRFPELPKNSNRKHNYSEYHYQHSWLFAASSGIPKVYIKICNKIVMVYDALCMTTQRKNKIYAVFHHFMCAKNFQIRHYRLVVSIIFPVKCTSHSTIQHISAVRNANDYSTNWFLLEKCRTHFKSFWYPQ